MKRHTRLGCGATGLAGIMATALLALAISWGVDLGIGARCAGRSHYTVGNCDWHVGWAPPGKELQAGPGTTCTHPDPQQSFECILQAGAEPVANFGVISDQCPTGCSCSSRFSERAARLERCLADVHRHLYCTPFEDDDGSLAAYHSPRKNDARFVDVTRRHYLTQDHFLDACEAAMTFAVRRGSHGIWLVLAILLPGIAWAIAFVGALRTSSQSGVERELTTSTKTAEKADKGIESALQVVAGPLFAALEAFGKLIDRYNSDFAALIRFSVLSQGVELALQLAWWLAV